jgi:hypothetical protein
MAQENHWLSGFNFNVMCGIKAPNRPSAMSGFFVNFVSKFCCFSIEVVPA